MKGNDNGNENERYESKMKDLKDNLTLIPETLLMILPHQHIPSDHVHVPASFIIIISSLISFVTLLFILYMFFYLLPRFSSALYMKRK